MKNTVRALCRFLPKAFFITFLIFPLCAAAHTGNTQSLSLPFVEQVSPSDSGVCFTARTLGGAAAVTSNGRIVYALPARDNKKACRLEEIPLRDAPLSGIRGQGLLKARATVFHGKAAKKTLRMFTGVSLGCITSGIDLSLKAYSDNIEKLYTIQPGADPTAIRMKVEGGTLSINKNGQLVILTAQGPVNFTAPVAYQEDLAGKKEPVQVAYTLQNNEYGFSVGAYDKDRVLVIDPLLASTYLGGVHFDDAYDIALDATGNVYVAGTTESGNFPIEGQALSGDSDGFIVKFNADLSEILAATFIGGSAYETINSIVVDNGKVYAAGQTESADFPATVGAYDPELAGSADVFILILDTDLATLEAATYLGGSIEPDFYGEDDPELALGADGDIFVTMLTYSDDFPMVSPEGSVPWDSTINKSKAHYGDVAIARLSGDLTTLKASTFLGGSTSTHGYGYEYNPRIALDASGDVWIAGITGATDFPTTEGAYRGSIVDGGDYVFLSRLDADLTDLEASTYLICSNSLRMVSLALADDGDVYVAGRPNFEVTYGETWPEIDGAYDTDATTGNKAFIFRLSSDLTTLEAATLLGGTLSTSMPVTQINDMLLDSTGQVIVAGITSCYDFPTTEDAYDTEADVCNIDNVDRSYPFFLAKLTADLGDLTAGTYLGNEGTGIGFNLAMALDDSENVYLCGRTFSPNFPTTESAFDTSFNSDQYSWDAFVSKLDSDLSRDISADLALSASLASVSGTAGGELSYVLTVTNDGPDAATQVVLTNTLPAGTTYVSATPEQGTTVHDSGVITCEVGTLATGSETSVTIVVTLPDTAGDINCSAMVDSAANDPDESDNSATFSVTVEELVVAATSSSSGCFIASATSARPGIMHKILAMLSGSAGR